MVPRTLLLGVSSLQERNKNNNNNSKKKQKQNNQQQTTTNIVVPADGAAHLAPWCFFRESTVLGFLTQQLPDQSSIWLEDKIKPKLGMKFVLKTMFSKINIEDILPAAPNAQFSLKDTGGD